MDIGGTVALFLIKLFNRSSLVFGLCWSLGNLCRWFFVSFKNKLTRGVEFNHKETIDKSGKVGRVPHK